MPKFPVSIILNYLKLLVSYPYLSIPIDYHLMSFNIDAHILSFTLFFSFSPYAEMNIN